MRDEFLPQELQAEEWIKKANDDELNARSILSHRDGTPGGACFLSQQMAEKYLKAFLVSQKHWFPKIHPIDKLLELCRDIDHSFASFEDDAILLTEFYTETRYPGDYPEFTWQDAEKAFEAALRIKEFVLEKIKLEKIKGFGIVGVVIIIAAVAVLGGSYWYWQAGIKVPPEISPETKDEVEISNWKTYRNEQYGFEVRYPADFVDSKDEIERLTLPQDTFYITNQRNDCQVYARFPVVASTKIPLLWDKRAESKMIANKDFSVTYVYDEKNKLVVVATQTIVPRIPREQNFSVSNFDYVTNKYNEINTSCKDTFNQILSTFKFIK